MSPTATSVSEVLGGLCGYSTAGVTPCCNLKKFTGKETKTRAIMLHRLGGRTRAATLSQHLFRCNGDDRTQHVSPCSA